MVKTCTRCGETKPLTEFNARSRAKDKRRSDCRACSRESNAEWYHRNRERARKTRLDWHRKNPGWSAAYYEANKEHIIARNQRSRVKRLYGLAAGEYEALIARGCVICGTCEGRICVDHDHESGAVRGALCNACNSMLGLARDDPGRLRAAADYVAQQRLPTHRGAA